MNTSTQPPDGAGESKARSRSKARRADTRPDGVHSLCGLAPNPVGAGLPAMAPHNQPTTVRCTQTKTVGASLPAKTPRQTPHDNQKHPNPCGEGPCSRWPAQQAQIQTTRIVSETACTGFRAAAPPQREQAPSPQKRVNVSCGVSSSPEHAPSDNPRQSETHHPCGEGARSRWPAQQAQIQTTRIVSETECTGSRAAAPPSGSKLPRHKSESIQTVVSADQYAPPGKPR